MSVLGYNLPKVYEGRGPLEAASIGVDLQPGEMAMRCNIICIEGDNIKNHSAGHITTEEADVVGKNTFRSIWVMTACISIRACNTAICW